MDYVAEVSDDRLVLRFGTPATPNTGGVRAPRNVTSIAAADGGVVIALRPGARVRHFRLGNRIVIDVHDGSSATAEARRAERRSRAAAPTTAAPQAVTAPAPAAPVAETAAVQAATPEPVAPVTETVALRAEPSAVPAPVAEPAPVQAAAPEPVAPVAETVALQAEPAASDAPAAESAPVQAAAPEPVAPVAETAAQRAEPAAVTAPVAEPALVQAAAPGPAAPVAEAALRAEPSAVTAPVAEPAPVAEAVALRAEPAASDAPVAEPVALRAEANASQPPADPPQVAAEPAPPTPLATDTEGMSQPGAEAAVTVAEASPAPATAMFGTPAGGSDEAPAALRISTEDPAEAQAEADAAPTIVVGDIGDQPEMPLSAAATAVAPIGTNVARPQPSVAAPAAPERITLTPAPTQPATAEAPSTAPVTVAQPAQAPRPDGGAKAEEPAAPAVAAATPTPAAAPGAARPAAAAASAAPSAARPATAARAPAAPQGGQVVLVQQQPSLPGGNGLPLQLTPGTTRIQVAPGQPIPPLLGGGATPAPVAPALSGPIPSDQRPALVPVPVMLEAGSGRLIQLPAPAAAVFAADPRVARVQPASPTSLFVMAVAAGRTNVIATGEDGTPIIEYDVSVAGRATGAAPAAPTFAAPTAPTAAGLPRPSVVESMIRRSIRGGEGVRVAALAQRGYILNGLVPNASDAQRAEAIAKAMGGEGSEVINNLSLLSAIQVNVRVRVAEISRQVTRELGFNWQAIGGSGDWLFGLTFGGAGLINRILPGVPSGTGDTTGRYGGRFSSGSTDINSIIDALAQDNLVSVLAEPNLTAQSGEVASFLAGGEFPVPIATGIGGSAQLSIEFKQYGVGLAFVPTVLSPERLNLRVRPEVSELSETGAVSVPLSTGVVRIPGLTVRRAETTIELGSGQSFAIAGLLTRNHTLSQNSLIGLGDIPVLGALFRSDRFRRQETELVIIVTPYLVRPVSDPRALVTPNQNFRPATDLERIMQRRQLRSGTTAAGPAGRRAPVDAGFIVE